MSTAQPYPGAHVPEWTLLNLMDRLPLPRITRGKNRGRPIKLPRRTMAALHMVYWAQVFDGPRKVTLYRNAVKRAGKDLADAAVNLGRA